MFRSVRRSAAAAASFILFLAPVTESQAAEKGRTLGEVFQAGGPVMWLLLLQSMLLVAVVVEAWRRFRVGELVPAETHRELHRWVGEGDLARAHGESRSRKDLFASAMDAALGRFSKGQEAARDAASDVLHVHATRMRGWLNYLSAIGVTAPMLGLLGTVMGMIKAFENLGHSGVADMTGLSAAISEVLVTTAGGLVVGIPAFVAYYILKNHLADSLATAEKEVFDLVDALPYGAPVAPEHAEPAAPAA
ncbi:MAG: MotA/TolQ/ExbB proton channel family protein [Candidatus Methylacidiphilales bacterium]|nr:MotA/TolQ/ExbB proton channel family protein [Candidatus Methylacidiphilales bacterium]